MLIFKKIDKWLARLFSIENKKSFAPELNDQNFNLDEWKVNKLDIKGYLNFKTINFYHETDFVFKETKCRSLFLVPWESKSINFKL